MSNSYGSRDLSETFQDFLTGAAKLVLGIGALATFASVGLLVFTCFRVSGDPTVAGEAIKNVGLFREILVVGALGLVIGSTYLFWGEELLAALQLFLSAALYFAPAYLPSLLGGTSTNEATAQALSAIGLGGMVMGLMSVVVLVVDLSLRVKNRIQTGAKADQLKYGKGVKEDSDRQNVFLGKCWQLPYCRKFVRERCPIFHAKRTCWRERTGCMCEEEVIRNAMENKPIPKDQVLAAQFIPRNQRLTEQQKFERCKTCVIYNEHQKHKYRALVPVILITFGLVYGLMHGTLLGAVQGAVEKINGILKIATINAVGAHIETPGVFVEGLLFVCLLVSLSYALKMLEYVVFKLKL